MIFLEVIPWNHKVDWVSLPTWTFDWNDCIITYNYVLQFMIWRSYPKRSSNYNGRQSIVRNWACLTACCSKWRSADARTVQSMQTRSFLKRKHVLSWQKEEWISLTDVLRETIRCEINQSTLRGYHLVHWLTRIEKPRAESSFFNCCSQVCYQLIRCPICPSGR